MRTVLYTLDKYPQSGDYEVAFWLDGELPLVIRSYRRAIMRDDVTDQSLPEVTDLVVGESLGGTALAKVIESILTSSAEGPSHSFQANI